MWSRRASETIVYGISDAATISVTLDVPVTMSLAGRDFVVLPQSMNADGSWSPGVVHDSAVGWVFGSIINYIMALESTGDNIELLRSLAPGSELVLTMQNGLI